MATIIPFLRSPRAFGQSDITAMSLALDDVCKALNLTGDSQTARKTVAARIIELARRGERSPTKLRDQVLAEAMGATAR